MVHYLGAPIGGFIESMDEQAIRSFLKEQADSIHTQLDALTKELKATEESGYRLELETDDVGETADISILNSPADPRSPRSLQL